MPNDPHAGNRLLAGLVDDAGLFPPTALAMPDAVARHRADLAAGHGVLTHRFLCPASRLGELRGELTEPDRMAIGLIADTGTQGLPGALRELDEDPRLRLAGLEFPLSGTDEPKPEGAVAAVLRATVEVPGAVPLFLEPATFGDAGATCAALTGREVSRTVGLKARCGGVRAELFPSVEALARFVLTAVAAGLPMKATAGLHHAVRYIDRGTGFTHHGYLNLLVAVADAVVGAGPDTVAATLRTTDSVGLASRAAGLDAATVAATRRVLTSYGSCSTRVPVEEAGALGLWHTAS
ncbi:hypothetical protein [Amycolatopsis cihanbeyliensis]|uniref:Uncharacterized protein n=1 Tax=Amycolatopsis cihanbeyliensis TaxID=1128664 RepID=A0A542DFK1_AMYCI|nr:hypothetical protein [Amycolatopsis cihanbeyliensis]TQJ01855.1 hypothetical protein FB471_1571 [Amycolatopsis cihanbeyliensis]